MFLGQKIAQKVDICPFIGVNGFFLEGVAQRESTATPLSMVAPNKAWLYRFMPNGGMP